MGRPTAVPRLLDAVTLYVAGPKPLGRLAETRQHVMA